MELLLAIILWATFASAQNPEVLGNPCAPAGGTISIRLPGEPPTLNPIISDGQQAVQIDFYVIEPLLWTNEHTGQWQRALADEWKITGGRFYEFHLRPGVKWSDGVPLTAEDVKFSFDVLFDENFPTAHMRPYYDQLERVEILAPDRVRFVAKEAYFGNFISSAGLPIVPKHIYGDPKKGPHIHRQLIGTGPYILEKYQPSRSISLRANPNWWGRKDPLYAGKHKPGRVVFKFVSDQNLAFEMLKKGELDYMDFSTEMLERARHSGQLGKRFFAREVQNLYPQTVSSIGFNLEHPLFRDPLVRRALAYLVDRDTMIEKFFRGHSEKATGPWYRQSRFSDPNVEEIPFSPIKAISLLKEAGWRDTDHDQILDKIVDGKKTELSFTILTSQKATERYLTVFKEDAKQAGVRIEIKVVDGGLMAKQLDSGRFAAADMSWSGGLVEFDPKPAWHSSNAKAGGLNLSRYRNARVDALIEKARTIYDVKERVPVMQQIYRQIAADLPRLFLFNANSFAYGYSNHVEMPAPTFDYDIGVKYWWVKQESKNVNPVVHTAQGGAHDPHAVRNHVHYLFDSESGAGRPH